MEDKEKKDSSWSVVSLAWELGYSIAVPLVALALIGRFLDKKLETSPWLLLAGIFLAITSSTYIVYIKMINIIKKP